MTRRNMALVTVALLVMAMTVVVALGQSKGGNAAQVTGKKVGASRPDIVTAVKAAAKKDCGCGMCAGKGCAPCKGKNCYFCVAKALVAQDCGCKDCDSKGCKSCGAGCDVCKFHLGPVAASKASATKPNK